MRKLLIFLAAIVLCAGCENYQADIDTYLSYWATEAAIVRSGFDPAITVQTDTDTIQSIPSSSDVTVTFTVRNPKNFTFQLPGDAGAPTDIIVFPSDVAGTMGSTPRQPDDYELAQDSNSQLTLTYKKEFLQKYEYGKKNIGPTITLYAKDGRKFSETFKLNVKANTPPPNLIYRAIGKTAASDGSGKYYYVLFLEVPGMDTEINSSELLHKDIKYLSIAEGSGSYTSIPLTVKADKRGFDISGAGGRLLEANATGQLATEDVEPDVTPDPLPASTEKWIIRIKTDVEVHGAVKQYRLRLQDEAGLLSEDELRASTSTNKVKPVTITVTSGSWTVTPKSGTNADPHEITYGPGVQKILLEAKTDTNGATVRYKLERNGLTVSESSGSTPLTIELPTVPNVVYKLTAWAEHTGFDNSPNVVVSYRSKGLEIKAGPNAWQQLKDAVENAADGDVIIVNGIIQATSTPGNNGEIPINKSITIRGKSGSGSDILDANKTAGSKEAHRIFKVTNCNLTLEGLTLKGGMATDTSDYLKKLGGGIYGKNIQNLTIKNCIIKDCEATTSGGGIYITTEADKPPTEVTIADTQILQNIAVQSGGGLEFISDQGTYITGTLDNVTIQGNRLTSLTATPPPHYGGAGVYFSGGYTKHSTLTVKGGIIDGNDAKDLYGGGIYIHTGASGYVNGTLTLKDGVRISGNKAKHGGGIAVNSAKAFMEGAATTIGGSGTNKNTASDSGGGVHVQKGIFTMSDGKITGNEAQMGGGVYGINFNSDKGEIIIKGSSEISENTATISGTLAGGGIGADYKLTVTDSVRIEQNHAPNGYGGGIACGYDIQSEFTGGTVTNNTAGGSGTGIYISYFKPNTYFKMSGSAKVETNNDVFLGGSNSSDYAYITVIGALKQMPTAKLTMNDSSGYIEGRAVVKGSSGYTLTAEDISTFTVTPGGSPSQNWYIDSNGKLTTTPPSS